MVVSVIFLMIDSRSTTIVYAPSLCIMSQYKKHYQRNFFVCASKINCRISRGSLTNALVRKPLRTTAP